MTVGAGRWNTVGSIAAAEIEDRRRVMTNGSPAGAGAAAASVGPAGIRANADSKIEVAWLSAISHSTQSAVTAVTAHSPHTVTARRFTAHRHSTPIHSTPSQHPPDRAKLRAGAPRAGTR